MCIIIGSYGGALVEKSYDTKRLLPAVNSSVRTSKEVKEEFRKKGISISGWAVANGYPPNLVYEVINERRNPTRGMTHQIAVKLGLKDGEIVQDLATAINA